MNEPEILMAINTGYSSTVLKYSALVIEDDDDLAELIECFFDASKWKVTLAKNLNEAAQMLCGRRFDLILADNRLPDGYSLNALPEMTSACDQFVLMTGDHELAKLAKERGVQWFIGKPFRKDDFKKILASFEG